MSRLKPFPGSRSKGLQDVVQLLPWPKSGPTVLLSFLRDSTLTCSLKN